MEQWGIELGRASMAALDLCKNVQQAHEDAGKSTLVFGPNRSLPVADNLQRLALSQSDKSEL